MVVSCTCRTVKELIDHDRACVKYRIMRPWEALQETEYDQPAVISDMDL